MTVYPMASWFETRGIAALLTMRVLDLILRGREYLRPHPEERALARVSKDGREFVRYLHPSRRLLRKLLRG